MSFHRRFNKHQGLVIDVAINNLTYAIDTVLFANNLQLLEELLTSVTEKIKTIKRKKFVPENEIRTLHNNNITLLRYYSNMDLKAGLIETICKKLKGFEM